MLTETGRILRKKRDDAGEKLKHMADKCGVSKQFISYIEHGERVLTARVYLALLDKYSFTDDEKSILEREMSKRLDLSELSLTERKEVRELMEKMRGGK